jgi:hypothetical protein
MISAFGVEHGDEVSKAESKGFKRDGKMSNSEKGAAAAAGAGATGAVATKTTLPEHSHYSKKTRKYIQSLEPGVHEVDTKMLAKKPRKLGARRQQTPYVAAMAQERPTPYSPVPITRYKDGVIQRDNAHSVMANAMKGRKTTIKVEDAPGYRPRRRTGEELVRRGQRNYQQLRLKRSFNMSEKQIEAQRARYKDSSRKANTSKRPHGVVEEGFKASLKQHPASKVVHRARKLKLVAKRDDRRSQASGAAGAAGVGVLASTPVRRSASKVDIKDGRMSAADAKKVVSPGWRPGNKKNIQTMSRNLGHLENQPTRVVRYKDGTAIPFDGNHRATARIARGDKSIPVSVIEGGDRPAVSAARNALQVGQQRVHRKRMARGDFKAKPTTGKHTAEGKLYGKIANGSKLRSGKRVAVGSTKIGSGPTKAALRTKQGITLTAGAGLLATSAHLDRRKKK